MTFYRLYRNRSDILLTYLDTTLLTLPVDFPSHFLHTPKVIQTTNRQDFITQSIPYIASLPIQIKSFRELLQYIFTHPTE